MNKIIYSLFFFLLILGCKKDSEAPILELSETTIKTSSLAENHSFSIVSNRAWKVISSENGWITINPASGNNNGKVTIACNANNSSKERSLVLTVRSEELEKSINLIQDAASPILQLSLSKKQVSYQAGSVQFELTTDNAAWKINSLPDWINANPLHGDKSGTITLNYQANTLKEKRSAQIVFSAGNVSQTLLIEQLTSIDANDGGNW